MNSGIALGACVFRTVQPDGGSYVNGLAVTGTNTYRSEPTNKNRIPSPSYQLFWTGTPTGTFTVQISNKLDPVLSTDADWNDLTLDKPIVQPAGSASKDYVDLAGLPFAWMRLKYVNASGSGSIFAFPGGS